MTRKKEEIGTVIGHNQEPIEHVRHDKPTHACFHADGTCSLVFPEGHDTETLVELPKGYDEDTHEPHHASRTFVQRKKPLSQLVAEQELAHLSDAALDLLTEKVMTRINRK